jgi:hypothetical protein
MTRRDWWLGIAAVVLALLVHAAVPRYDWRIAQGRPAIRIDRWLGRADVGGFDQGRWLTAAEFSARKVPAPSWVEGAASRVDSWLESLSNWFSGPLYADDASRKHRPTAVTVGAPSVADGRGF